MALNIDSDRALDDEDSDKFGFVGMAKRLAPSIVEASKGDGIVIGLEGRWGSGKTSLLNFLRAELTGAEMANIHTITIAPWLSGDASSLVMSLLDPIATILMQREEELAAANGNQDEGIKDKIADLSRLLREYGPSTARRLAPVAGLFVPGGAEAVQGVINQVVPRVASASELKQLISQKIKELDMGFIVVLDDLDRLEPSQAVEVVRLVRSVADFPRVAYLMCYDREVLAQALKTGLKVKDGDLFLQKIVQLTFNIPLPEPFELRAQFLAGSKEIYTESIGAELNKEELQDLHSAVDREGVGLSTPREVKLALNSIRFVYPQITEDVYFPDFCRLHLIKTTNFQLYQWLEVYLSVRSVLVTGDASVPSDERAGMGKTLKKLLPSDDIGSMRSIWGLRKFIPGVMKSDKAEKRVFSEVSMQEAGNAIKFKRLGSPFHYRFYFALTGPKTVMPDGDFNELLTLAKDNHEELSTRLANYATQRRSSGKTWLEHILDRLDNEYVDGLNEAQLEGLIIALSNMMDAAITADNEPRPFSLSLDGIANMVFKRCLLKLRHFNPDRQAAVLRQVAHEGAAINWLVGKFFRSQLFNHGRVGEEVVNPDQRVLTEEILDEVIEILKERIGRPDTMAQVADLPDVSAYLYGWLNITSNEDAVSWVVDYCNDDIGFLKLLNHLRSWSMGDKVYYPLSQDAVSRFLDWDETLTRLEQLRGGEHDQIVQDLELAIQQSRH